MSETRIDFREAGRANITVPPKSDCTWNFIFRDSEGEDYDHVGKTYRLEVYNRGTGNIVTYGSSEDLLIYEPSVIGAGFSIQQNKEDIPFLNEFDYDYAIWKIEDAKEIPWIWGNLRGSKGANNSSPSAEITVTESSSNITVQITNSTIISGGGGGNGDMLKSAYDSNNDGRVNSADQISNGSAIVTASQARVHIDDSTVHITQALLDEIASKVPQARTINNKDLSENIEITKEDIGDLENVDNTSDETKLNDFLNAIRQGVLEAGDDLSKLYALIVANSGNFANYIPTSARNAANGVVGLNENSEIDPEYLPSSAINDVFTSGESTLEDFIDIEFGEVGYDDISTGDVIQIEVDTDIYQLWQLTSAGDGSSAAHWKQIDATQVTWGNVTGAPTEFTPIAHDHNTLYNTKAEITTFLASKVPTSRTVNGRALTSNITLTKADVNLGAVNNTSDATKQAATLTAIRNGVATEGNDLAKLYALIVANAAKLISDEPTLDTLQKVVTYIQALGAAISSLTIGDISGLQNELDIKAPLASPILTGTPTTPTASFGTNTTQIASTAFAQAAVDGRLKVSSGSGAPTANATLLPELYLDTNASAWYISVQIGQGASDWKPLLHSVIA